MQLVRFLPPWLSRVVVAFLLAGGPTSVLAEGDTSAAGAAIARRVLERAQEVARSGKARAYTYDKRSVQEELDGDQRVIKSTEKFYKVDLIGGLPFSRLVKIQGRELTEEELERENRREREFRQKVTRVDLSGKVQRKESWMTQELVDRFEFAILKRESIRGRPTVVLSFTPKAAPAGEETFQDKILTRLTGTIWVDEEEHEIAKMDASLLGTISLGWFGWIGSLNRCQMTIERSRMPDGVWVNAKHTLWIVARKLFGSMRYKTTEESSGFSRAP